MKLCRFNEEQIIGTLHEHEGDITIVDLCLKHAIGKAPFFKWKARLGEMYGSDARKPKAT